MIGTGLGTMEWTTASCASNTSAYVRCQMHFNLMDLSVTDMAPHHCRSPPTLESARPIAFLNNTLSRTGLKFWMRHAVVEYMLLSSDAARKNMLMRFSKVTPDGEYVPPPPANAKASFSTMTYVRATIVEDAGEYLARAVTIAVRCTEHPIRKLFVNDKIGVIWLCK